VPRKWTNSGGGGGGSVNHKFVSPTPFRMQGVNGPPNLWEVDQILLRNAKAAGHDKQDRKRFRP
jgi:hypothetical protein